MGMNFCDACGRPEPGGISIGGTILCRTCAEDVRTEIDKRRAAGKPVNALLIAKQIYRETYKFGDYQLREIPGELWTKAKHRAVDEKISLRELIFKALYAYLQR